MDDDDIERILTREMPEKAGFSIEEAVNGVEPVEAVRDRRPDIVFPDVFMPEMDGFEACSAIRRLPGGAHTPILVVTSGDDTDSIERAYDVGATDFMAKPINWPLLGHRLRYIDWANRAFRESVECRAELVEAQKIAHLGSWQLDVLADLIRCSVETQEISDWDDEPAPMGLDTLLDRVHVEDQDYVRSTIQDGLSKWSSLLSTFASCGPMGPSAALRSGAHPIDDGSRQGPVFKGTFQDISVPRRRGDVPMI